MNGMLRCALIFAAATSAMMAQAAEKNAPPAQINDALKVCNDSAVSAVHQQANVICLKGRVEDILPFTAQLPAGHHPSR